MKSIYIGNLAYTTTQQQVHDIFAQFGNVISSRMILDKTTHKFKGYAFVEMDDENAETAVSMLNGESYHGRIMRVSIAN
ncbi:MAG: RNA-binding protein [Helicobacter sp.]|uniref:RNA recognition motif domain-containing protein n=1 Tax=Helicobacter sp. TaxID=218 RepID=UPI002A9163B2|nr:RNA-binding protein [Helicobacter sp.]MDY5821413.1 RNA-binding protein [Helicobacter sp.]